MKNRISQKKTTTTETKNKYNANSDIGVMTVSHQWYTK